MGAETRDSSVVRDPPDLDLASAVTGSDKLFIPADSNAVIRLSVAGFFVLRLERADFFYPITKAQECDGIQIGNIGDRDSMGSGRSLWSAVEYPRAILGPW